MLSGIRNNVLKMPLTSASVSESVLGCFKDVSELILILARTNNALELDHRSLAYPIEYHQ